MTAMTKRRRPQLSTGIKGVPAQTRARLDPSLTTRREQARRHGMTLDELDLLAERQGEACAICGMTGPLVIDHSHEDAEADGHEPTRGCRRCVRGLLCDYCNTGLAKFQDRPDVLRQAADFLEAYMLRRAAMVGAEPW